MKPNRSTNRIKFRTPLYLVREMSDDSVGVVVGFATAYPLGVWQ